MLTCDEHHIYRNDRGEVVPGVTNIIGEFIDDPELPFLINRYTGARIPRNIIETKRDFGTEAHKNFKLIGEGIYPTATKGQEFVIEALNNFYQDHGLDYTMPCAGPIQSVVELKTTASEAPCVGLQTILYQMGAVNTDARGHEVQIHNIRLNYCGTADYIGSVDGISGGRWVLYIRDNIDLFANGGRGYLFKRLDTLKTDDKQDALSLLRIYKRLRK